jgi:hypothetical protein
MSGIKRQAPYKHADGSDCYTKDCSLGKPVSREAIIAQAYNELETKLAEFDKHNTTKEGKPFYPVKDKVTVNGVTYHRRRENVFPDAPYSMRIQVNRTISDEEIKKMADIIGYNYRQTVNGESVGIPQRDSDRSFVIFTDTTKGSPERLDIFEEKLPDIMRDGSPIRKTDRSGLGTKGTRLTPGMEEDLGVELYYDQVMDYTQDSAGIHSNDIKNEHN